MFTGKLEITVVSADLTDFTSGASPEWRKENMNILVNIFVDNIDLGSTETKFGTNK